MASAPIKFEGMFPRVTLISCTLIGLLFVVSGALAGLVWAIGNTDSPHMAKFVFGMLGLGALFLAGSYWAYHKLEKLADSDRESRS